MDIIASLQPFYDLDHVSFAIGKTDNASPADGLHDIAQKFDIGSFEMSQCRIKIIHLPCNVADARIGRRPDDGTDWHCAA